MIPEEITINVGADLYEAMDTAAGLAGMTIEDWSRAILSAAVIAAIGEQARERQDPVG